MSQSDTRSTVFDVDFLIVGSGFGGSVSACRLSEKGYSVTVVEMGRRWSPTTLPASNWNLRRWLWRPGLGLFGFFNLRFFRHVMVVTGNAVGGGSITYANTLLVPPASVWNSGSWAGAADWTNVMPAHYDTAQKMMGVTENKILGDADRLLQRMAERIGRGDTFYRTRVATWFGREGEPGGTPTADPYFNGQGPARTSCTGCGGCMMGCKVGAKNTLDQNYLYFAEKNGAQVLAETRVLSIKPLAAADGSAGYAVEIETPTTGWRRQRRVIRAQNVVVAASSLGTMELLLKQKADGNLPHLSAQLGRKVRTNSESLICIRFKDPQLDLSKGVAIGSGIYIDQHTHIEAVRYPEGSDAIVAFITILNNAHPGVPRWISWLSAAVRHPVQFLRIHNPIGFAKQTMILLCMQTLDGHIDMRLKRPWLWPFMRVLSSSGQPIPPYIPQVNDFARDSARQFGGIAGSGSVESLLNIPATAHCMGGAAIGHSAADGVVDYRCRVFGYQNLYICDGSILGGNLGVNPSLTIMALTEQAMSHIPAKNGSTSGASLQPQMQPAG